MLNFFLAASIYAALLQNFNWFVSAVLLIPIYLVINILLLIMCRGGVARLLVLRKLRAQVLNKLPDDAVLVCSGTGRERTIQLVRYDLTTGRESLTDLWHGRVLAWRQGAREVSCIRRQASRQFGSGIAVLILLTVPALAVTVWAGVTVHWTGFVLALFIAATNFLAYLILLPDALAAPMMDALDSLL